MNLLQRLKGGAAPAERMTLDEYVGQLNSFVYGGMSYPLQGVSPIQQTMGGTVTEMAPNNFVGYAQAAYSANGVVFACMMVRQLVFSSIRFRWQRLRDGKPSDTFGNSDLGLLERPWPGGTTQDMLSRMIQDTDLCGNSYWTVQGGQLVHLRPDWVEVMVVPRMMADGRGQVGWEKLGYRYTEGGVQSGAEPVGLLASEVAHFAPIPDPLATYRGMSWLTPILREIQADQSMTRHQRAFFDNAATPNMVIKHFPGAPGVQGATRESVEKWVAEFESRHAGAANAYKTLQLYPGADVTVVGSNLKDIDFKEIRGGGETRIAAAAGVPPVIVGLSEGLAAATYSNYGQARRRLADGTAHPLWQNLAGSMETLLPSPGSDVRLWYDASDVPFLREDERDAADIAATRAQTISTLITAGYEPDSVIAAVESGDNRLLTHTGLYSVQLQPPGAMTVADTAPSDTGGNQ